MRARRQNARMKTLAALAFTALLVAPPCFAQPPTPPLLAPSFLSGPPDANGPLEAGERAAMAAQSASDERIAQARADNALHPNHIFGPIFGEHFDTNQMPQTARLLMQVRVEIGRSSNAAKDSWPRPRPFVTNPEVATCLERDPALTNSGAYPSGHAAAAWAWGLVLVELAPQHAEAILARARDFGDSRVICGLHYPSDVAAARDLAAGVVARLHAEPEFIALISSARAELQR